MKTYHNLTALQTAQELKTNTKTGLTSSEVKKRQCYKFIIFFSNYKSLRNKNQGNRIKFW